jgi:class 3 adenylate cyclase
MNHVSEYACTRCKKPTPFGVNFCPHCGQNQASMTGQLWMGDRRLVTVLFADLASFTATSEKTDPEDVIDILNQVFTRLSEEYDREGGISG